MRTLIVMILLSITNYASVLTKIQSRFDVNTTIANIAASIQSRSESGLRVVTIVDHAQNAKEVDLELRPTQVIFFGNPNAGTPLMNIDPRIAYELPVRIMAYEDAEGTTWIAYKETTELSQRFELNDNPVPENVAGLMKTLAMENAVENAEFITSTRPVSQTPELVRIRSSLDVSTIVENLNTAIPTRPGFRIAFTVDHLANAQGVGLTQKPSTVIVFENPAGGTLLIQQNQELGYELPLKMLAYEDLDGQTWLSFKSPHVYTRDFNLTKAPLQTNIGNLLVGLARPNALLNAELRSNAVTSSIEADSDDSDVAFTLPEDGSVKFSKILPNNVTSFVKIKLDTQVVSGFTQSNGDEDITFPHPVLTAGSANAKLTSTITVESNLNETITFEGN